MAKLNLGDFELELTLDEVDEDFYYEYSITIRFRGGNVYKPWLTQAGPQADNRIFMPADESFDECFRPLLVEEWPIKLRDHEDGNWTTVVAFPSAFLPTLEFNGSLGTGEEGWVELGRMARIREERRLNHDTSPIELDRWSSFEKVLFRFQYSHAALGIPRRVEAYPPVSSFGSMSFDAYISYADLERFLDQLEKERKELMQLRKK